MCVLYIIISLNYIKER